MQKGTDVEFKSLLTEKEYNKLLEYFTNAKSDFQTNHYFDTKRFSLKALNASLRVREREDFELTLKRKKGYNTDLKSITIFPFKSMKPYFPSFFMHANPSLKSPS